MVGYVIISNSFSRTSFARFYSVHRKIGENIKGIIGKVITLNRLLLATFSIHLLSTRFCFKHLLRSISKTDSQGQVKRV